MNLSLQCQMSGAWNKPEFTVRKVRYLKGTWVSVPMVRYLKWTWVYSAKGPVLEMNLSLQCQRSGTWNEPEFTVPKVRYLKWTWVYSAKGPVLERNLSLQYQWSGTWNEPEFTVPKAWYLKGTWVYSARKDEPKLFKFQNLKDNFLSLLFLLTYKRFENKLFLHEFQKKTK